MAVLAVRMNRAGPGRPAAIEPSGSPGASTSSRLPRGWTPSRIERLRANAGDRPPFDPVAGGDARPQVRGGGRAGLLPPEGAVASSGTGIRAPDRDLGRPDPGRGREEDRRGPVVARVNWVRSCRASRRAADGPPCRPWGRPRPAPLDGVPAGQCRGRSFGGLGPVRGRPDRPRAAFDPADRDRSGSLSRFKPRPIAGKLSGEDIGRPARVHPVAESPCRPRPRKLSAPISDCSAACSARRSAGSRARRPSTLVEEVRASAKGLRADSVAGGGPAAPRPAGPARPGRAPDPDPGLQHLLRPDQPGRAAGPGPRDPRPPPAERRPSRIDESPEAALRQLRDRGIDAGQVAEHLDRALICPVFTAHPSEARRRTILEKLSAIARQLDRPRVRPARPLGARAGHRRDRRGGRDPLALRHHPRGPAHRPRRGPPGARAGRGEPARGRPPGLPEPRGRARPGLPRATTGRSPPFLRFGSWIGGDRDGHPGVSAPTTAEAVRLQQESLIRHYLERVDDLWRRLSHSEPLRRARRGLPRLARRRTPRSSPAWPTPTTTSPTGPSAG